MLQLVKIKSFILFQFLTILGTTTTGILAAMASDGAHLTQTLQVSIETNKYNCSTKLDHFTNKKIISQ